MGVLCSIAVPSAVGTRRALGADAGARHLALVLREAQARAQASGARTAVQVAPDGSYEVAEAARRRLAGDASAASCSPR